MGLETPKQGKPPKPKRPAAHDAATLVGVLRERMRLLVVCLSHSWGGLEQIAVNDALDLVSEGLHVHFLCLEGSPVHDHLAKHAGITVVPLSFKPRDFLDFKLRAELQKLLDQGKINLIHCHQPTLLGSIVPWVWNQRNVVLLASRHIMTSHNKKDPFHALLYRRLDALLVMSQTLRDNVLATHSLRERQVKVIHYGLDFDLFDPDRVNATEQRRVWGADSETAVIGLVGRIDPAKGQDVFIKAAAGLLKNPKKAEKFKFVIVGEETLGSTGKFLDELKQMVQELGLGEHVYFAGYQENIPEVMCAFDVFVMPSRQEAFGLVAIEAMAMKCPIVISRGGSASEIVGQEEFGLLVRPLDAFDLQRQLRYLLDHPMKRIEMGEKAREHVKKHYDRRIRFERTLDIYEHMLRRRGM